MRPSHMKINMLLIRSTQKWRLQLTLTLTHWLFGKSGPLPVTTTWSCLLDSETNRLVSVTRDHEWWLVGCDGIHRSFIQQLQSRALVFHYLAGWINSRTRSCIDSGKWKPDRSTLSCRLNWINESDPGILGDKSLDLTFFWDMVRDSPQLVILSVQ